MFKKIIFLSLISFCLTNEIFSTKNPPQIVEVCGGVKSIETEPNGDKGSRSIVICGTDQSKICYRYVVEDPNRNGNIINQENPVLAGNHIGIFDISGNLIDSGKVELHSISPINLITNEIRHEFKLLNSYKAALPLNPVIINHPGRYIGTHKPDEANPTVWIYCNNTYPEEVCFTTESADPRINSTINLSKHNGLISPSLKLKIQEINGTYEMFIKSKLTQVNPLNLNEVSHIFINE